MATQTYYIGSDTAPFSTTNNPINVRTDGCKILCATIKEGKAEWDIRTLESRF